MSLAIDVLEPSALLIVCQVLDGALLTRLRGVKPGIGGAVNVRFCLIYVIYRGCPPERNHNLFGGLRANAGIFFISCHSDKQYSARAEPDVDPLARPPEYLDQSGRTRKYPNRPAVHSG